MRRLLMVTLALMIAVTPNGWALAATAKAEPSESLGVTSLKTNGDSPAHTFKVEGSGGDVVTGDRPSWQTSENTQFSYRLTDSTLAATIVGLDQWWSLKIAAPQGQGIKVGDYFNAALFSDHGDRPGLEFSGWDPACSSITGKFHIVDFARGADGQLKRLELRFEQHCNSGSSFSQGHLILANPAPPSALQIDSSVDSHGRANTVDGHAVISGRAICSHDAQIRVRGEIGRSINGRVDLRWFSQVIDCRKDIEVPWSAMVRLEFGGPAFRPGAVRVVLTAVGADEAWHGSMASTHEVILVKDET